MCWRWCIARSSCLRKWLKRSSTGNLPGGWDGQEMVEGVRYPRVMRDEELI